MKILLFIIILSITSYSYSIEPKSNTSNNLNNLFYIEEKLIDEDRDFFKSYIKYPFLNIDKEIVIKENYDSKFLEDINNDIFNYIDSFYNEILSMSNQYKIDYKNQKYNTIKYKFEAYSKFNTTYNKNNILSIPILTYSFTGGAHGNSYLKSFNYDLYNKKELKLCDLFKDNIDYKKLIEKFIKDEIRKNPSNYFSEKDFKITEEQEFYIDAKGISIYFQTYDIAPYYMGIVEFKLLFDEFDYALK